jgi:predicted oxidoreductase
MLGLKGKREELKKMCDGVEVDIYKLELQLKYNKRQEIANPRNAEVQNAIRQQEAQITALKGFRQFLDDEMEIT